MDFKELDGLLPKEITESDDPNLFRDLRDYADSKVQSAKKKKMDSMLGQFRETYVGKSVLVYGRVYQKIGTSFVNKSDITIVKMHSVEYAGLNFIAGNATVLHIVYGDASRPAIFGNQFDSDRIEVNAYADKDYHLDTAYELTFLSEEEVQKYLTMVRADVANSLAWFIEHSAMENTKTEETADANPANI